MTHQSLFPLQTTRVLVLAGLAFYSYVVLVMAAALTTAGTFGGFLAGVVVFAAIALAWVVLNRFRHVHRLW